MTTKKKASPLGDAILEMAEEQHRFGIVDDATYGKITLRHFGNKVLKTMQPISGEDIRAVRERENLSQAAFARYLNLTAGYVSQLERGIKRPTGPALALLNVIRCKGIVVMN